MWQRWVRKFGFAFQGVAAGVRGQDSFWVHLPVALTVLGLAALLALQSWQWCMLLVCIAIVLVAEYFNTAIEILVRKLHPDRDPEIAKALDIAAAAVLIASLMAATIGCIILVPELLSRLLKFF